MITKDAIVKIIGKDKYNGMIEAGVSDISILENACLTAFLYPGATEIESSLRFALKSVWNVPPGSFKLDLDFAS